MKLSLGLVAVLMVALAPGARADVLVQTTFDSDRQGWSPGAFAGTGPSDFWQSTGGNPGGAVRSFDQSSSSGLPSWSFGNTTTFNGDRSAAYDGALTFDLWSNGSGALKTNASFPDFRFDILIVGTIPISGGGFSSGFLAYVGLTAPTGDVWTSYSLTLNETTPGWRYNTNFFSSPPNWNPPTQAQLQGVLSNITDIQIRGDYWQANETTWLDNVALTTIPEPASGAGGLGLLVLGGLGVLIRSKGFMV